MKSILDLVCLNTQVGSVIGKGGVCEWEGGGGWKGLWNCRAAKAEDVYQCHVNELIRLASLCDSSHKTFIQF